MSTVVAKPGDLQPEATLALPKLDRLPTDMSRELIADAAVESLIARKVHKLALRGATEAA